METCINLTDCELCLGNLKNHTPRTELVAGKKMQDALKAFLITLNVNDHLSESSLYYSEETLAEVILENYDKFNNQADVIEFMQIFHFEGEIDCLVAEFIVKMLEASVSTFGSCQEVLCSSAEDSEDTSDNDYDSDDSVSSEYFDSDPQDS
jgi:hypothetical protein